VCPPRDVAPARPYSERSVGATAIGRLGFRKPCNAHRRAAFDDLRHARRFAPVASPVRGSVCCHASVRAPDRLASWRPAALLANAASPPQIILADVRGAAKLSSAPWRKQPVVRCASKPSIRQPRAPQCPARGCLARVPSWRSSLRFGGGRRLPQPNDANSSAR